MYQKRFSITKKRKSVKSDVETICGVPISCCKQLSEDSLTVQNGCPSVREIHEMYVNGLPTPESRKGRYSEKEGFDAALDGNIPFEAVGTMQRAILANAKELKQKEDAAKQYEDEIKLLREKLEKENTTETKNA